MDPIYRRFWIFNAIMITIGISLIIAGVIVNAIFY